MNIVDEVKICDFKIFNDLRDLTERTICGIKLKNNSLGYFTHKSDAKHMVTVFSKCNFHFGIVPTMCIYNVSKSC
jgi:hypothetical protein